MAGLFAGGACIAAAIGVVWPAARLAFLIAVVLLLTFACFYKLTIQVDADTLRASFGTGLIAKRVRIADIASSEPIRIRWWYGWGIHLTPYGWLYNVSGLDAVVITLRNDRKLALGTNDPQGLARAILGAVP
jgi:hypothetical protein